MHKDYMGWVMLMHSWTFTLGLNDDTTELKNYILYLLAYLFR